MLVVPIKLSNNGQFPSNSTSEPDSDLVKQCLQGEIQSYGLLYRRHQQRVRSILSQCEPSSLDDLVQEVFVRA